MAGAAEKDGCGGVGGWGGGGGRGEVGGGGALKKEKEEDRFKLCTPNPDERLTGKCSAL